LVSLLLFFCKLNYRSANNCLSTGGKCFTPVLLATSPPYVWNMTRIQDVREGFFTCGDIPPRAYAASSCQSTKHAAIASRSSRCQLLAQTYLAHDLNCLTTYITNLKSCDSYNDVRSI